MLSIGDKQFSIRAEKTDTNGGLTARTGARTSQKRRLKGCCTLEKRAALRIYENTKPKKSLMQQTHTGEAAQMKHTKNSAPESSAEGGDGAERCVCIRQWWAVNDR